jgi:hypothetical protein
MKYFFELKKQAYITDNILVHISQTSDDTHALTTSFNIVVHVRIFFSFDKEESNDTHHQYSSSLHLMQTLYSLGTFL